MIKGVIYRSEDCYIFFNGWFYLNKGGNWKNNIGII